MKYLLITLVIFLSSCVTTVELPIETDLTGKLLGSYVSMPSGLVKGHILHIEETSSIEKVSGIGTGNTRQVLLIHNDPESFDMFMGKKVRVFGELHSEHMKIFHTDFILKISEIVAE